PGFATGHHWYSYVLLVNGQSEQAMTEVLTALELDPSSLSVRRGVGWISYYTRRYEQALYHLRRAVAMNPTSEDTYRVMGLVLMQQGAYAEAERAFREAITLSPDLSYATAVVAHVLALSGRRREAQAMVDERDRGSRHVEPAGRGRPPDPRRRNRLDPAGEAHPHQGRIAGVRAIRPIRAGPALHGLVARTTAGSIC